MKTSHPKAFCVLSALILALGLVLVGCKKQAPTTQQPRATAQGQPDPVKEKEFLSDPDVTICDLEETTIEGVDFPEGSRPSFVRRMERDNRSTLKQGKLTLAGRPFKVLLGDRPEREFFLYDVEKKFGPYWWGSWSLHSYHKIDDGFFEFMLVEDGVKIAARPYKGDLGIIKVGKGDRDLEKTEFNGSVHQAGSVSAPIGTIEEHWTGPVPECKIPVGDYTAYLMDVTYDNLSIDISNNYHTNARGQSNGKQTVYGMHVRKDKPYVLDFSNEPMVVFDQPPKDKTSFSLGEEIKFAAVLIDPELDIMIRGLDDASVEVDKEYKDADGKVIHTGKEPKSLDPTVVITRADGQIVGEGIMPFG